MNRLLGSCAFLLVLTLATPRASANTCSDPDGCPWMIFPMSALLFVLGDAIFMAAEIEYADRVMPPEWAIPELLFGAATIALGAAMLAVGNDRDDDLSDLLYGGAAGAFAFGTWFLSHAIGSLIHHALEPPR